MGRLEPGAGGEFSIIDKDRFERTIAEKISPEDQG